MKTTAEKPILITLNIDSSILKALENSFESFHRVDHLYDSEIMEGPLQLPVSALICGLPPENISVIEVGQILRMFYQDIDIYFVTQSRGQFDRKDLQKNGFTEVFFFPQDVNVMNRAMNRTASRASNGKTRAFKTIHLADLPIDKPLDFDLYIHLPLNNKRIRYVAEGQSLGQDKAKKLKQHQMQSALVLEEQADKFYQFTSRELSSTPAKTKMTETERAEKREVAVRDLLTSFLSEAGAGDNIGYGRQIMAECQRIIQDFVFDQKGHEVHWLERLLSITNSEPTTYSQAANVATIASLLSIGLNIGRPEDVALAGLLHNLGYAEIPADIFLKPDSLRSSIEQTTYQKYPLSSVAMIKERKLIVTDVVIKFIEQHRERFDGMGFPQRVPGARVSEEAQLIGFACAVNDSIAIKSGKRKKSIRVAILEVCESDLTVMGQSAFDPGLIRKIQSIVSKSKEK